MRLSWLPWLVIVACSLHCLFRRMKKTALSSIVPNLHSAHISEMPCSHLLLCIYDQFGYQFGCVRTVVYVLGKEVLSLHTT